MKAILEFNMDDPDDSEKFQMYTDASSLTNAIHQIRQEVFRPNRKHGYADQKIADIISKSPDVCSELIEALEEKFGEILEENNVLKYS